MQKKYPRNNWHNSFEAGPHIVSASWAILTCCTEVHTTRHFCGGVKGWGLVPSTPLGSSSPFPVPSLPLPLPSPALPVLSPPIKSRPINPAMESGERCKLPSAQSDDNNFNEFLESQLTKFQTFMPLSVISV